MKMNRGFNEDGYIEIFDIVNSYPDAWCFLVWSARGGSDGAGKTYSTLKWLMLNRKKFIFIKRTNKDVNFLCAGNKKKTSKGYKNVDNSPFSPINRDFKTNIKPLQFDDGYGAFYNCTDDDEPIGEPIGYILSLNLAKDIKGFDLSDADFLVFDEFIPQRFERLHNRREDEALLSIYKTVDRDRRKKGRDKLIMICTANASDISNPVFNVLEVINDVAIMNPEITEIKYLKNRGIVLWSLFWDVNMEKLDGLDKAMIGTKWFDANVKGGFAYNDFSNVIPKYSIKGMKCRFRLNVGSRSYYYYFNDNGMGYFGTQKSNKYERIYNLDKDNDVSAFYRDVVLDIAYKTSYNKIKYCDYASYDLIINYKKYYKV